MARIRNVNVDLTIEKLTDMEDELFELSERLPGDLHAWPAYTTNYAILRRKLYGMRMLPQHADKCRLYHGVAMNERDTRIALRLSGIVYKILCAPNSDTMSRFGVGISAEHSLLRSAHPVTVYFIRLRFDDGGKLVFNKDLEVPHERLIYFIHCKE